MKLKTFTVVAYAYTGAKLIESEHDNYKSAHDFSVALHGRRDVSRVAIESSDYRNNWR